MNFGGKNLEDVILYKSEVSNDTCAISTLYIV
jgi:hypothetical protein